MSKILSCHNLSLKIHDKILFSNFGLTLFPGSITHLMGANGSGKTSLLRIISGIQNNETGKIKFGGINVTELEKPYSNYIGHNIGIKEDLTTLENLEIFAKLHGSSLALASALHYFGLSELIDKKIYSLSAGNKQKVALARLLSCHADLWLLDEISTNLDSTNHELLCKILITKASSGGIIIMTSHNEIPIQNLIKVDIKDFYG